MNVPDDFKNTITTERRTRNGVRWTPMDLTKLTPEEFDRFRTFIYGETGIRLDDRKITLVLKSIVDRFLEPLKLENVDVSL